jgi:putative ABC transport system permease protein
VSGLFRQAWLSWSRARGTALLAILAFAVGIGSTTAIYTVVNSVLLAPLPYPDGDRFVELFAANESEPAGYSAHPIADALEYERAGSFDLFGVFRLDALNLTAPGEPRNLNVLHVTPALVQNLGVAPALGQWFGDETGAVLSDAVWRRLGGDRALVGQAITLGGRRLTVTGVMPPRFRLPMSAPGTEGFDTDIWIHMDPRGRGQPQDAGLFFIYARRKPGVPLTEAEAEVKRIAAGIARQSPGRVGYTAKLEDLRESSTQAIRPLLLLLFAAAGLLLLVTCANVAALLLARSVARARETAVRVALGARHHQLAMLYFVEGLPISIAGAAAGLAAGILLVRVVLRLASGFIPRADEVRIDWTVFAFAAATAFLSSAVCSVAPLWQALSATPNDALSAGVRASAGARARRLSRALVVAEVALAFALLAVSAVLITHMRNLARVAPGFNPDRLLTFDLTIPESLARDEKVRVPFERRLIDALEAVRGVDAAAFANQLPLDGCCLGGTLVPDGRPVNPDQAQRVAFVIATPGFVRTMQIPLVSGRLLDDRDAIQDLLLILVNQAAVMRYWPGQNPIDATGHLNTPNGPPFRVVGVVGDVRNQGLGKNAEAEAYLINRVTAINPMVFLVRSSLSTDVLIAEVRRAVHGVDPTLAIQEPKMMTTIVRESLSLERVASFVMTFFALAALLMATLGVYGVMAYGVRQRTVEIGTRMALGATSRDVVGLVLRGGLLMAAAGIAIGAVVVIATTGTVQQFFSTAAVGPAPYIWSTAVVVLVAGLASSLPAWRATLLPPTTAIRDDAPSVWQQTRRRLQATVKTT